MLIPATQYRDTEAALRFLIEVLELREHAVFRDEAGGIVHAQLGLGQGMMMFGPAGASGLDALMVAPAEAGGRVSTAVYAVVPEVASLHDRVRSRGADIVIPLRSEAHGGQSFTVRDPEAHIWTFGDYDPRVAAD